MSPHATMARLRGPIPGRLSRRAGVPRRGLIGGAIALALGAGLCLAGAGTIGAGDLLVLGLLAVGSAIGARSARRMAVAPQAEAVAEGGWLRVVVAAGGPADGQVLAGRPSGSPRRDPERRSLARRAATRRKDAVASGR